MTAKKVAAKTKKSEPKAEEKSPQTVEEAAQAAPEMEGEAYQAGYHGVSSDDEDYSVAAQVAKLAE